jgi:alkyl hydroperoxide reductase subunit F
MIRESAGHRHVRKADIKENYDTIIVGGGPAAMSAAVYAARKEMNVLLVSKDIGGQITYTASVDNYLGLPSISGKGLKDQFRFHMEKYAIAESIGENVLKIEKKKDVFTVKTEDGNSFKGYSLIFATGKEYRRLGVPGEDKFIGHGIAFCATCDAPLYKGKKVAVVGGGNSAFTAARDLINFATEIHLLHRSNSFKANASLVNEIKNAKNVKFHTNTIIQEFLGRDRLSGVKLKSTTGKESLSLHLDGIFLEIGLTPNTGPVRDLITLNKHGEIPIKDDNSTSIPGFFAAGDATDVPEKQIIVAAGEGAKAALSAYRYLLNRKIIQRKTTESLQ